MTISLSVLTTCLFVAAIFAVVGWTKYDKCVQARIEDEKDFKEKIGRLKADRDNLVSRLSSR